METLLATIAVFGAVMAAMAVGVVVHGRRLKGSCGGTGVGCTCSPLAAGACPVRREREKQDRA